MAKLNEFDEKSLQQLAVAFEDAIAKMDVPEDAILEEINFGVQEGDKAVDKLVCKRVNGRIVCKSSWD